MFDWWTTDRRTINTGLDYQCVKGSSSDIKNPTYLIAAHQNEAGTGVPNKANKIALFDHYDVRKYFVEMIGVRYPKDAIILDYSKNDYLNKIEIL